MKILHTADLHIGSPLTARLSPEKIRQRKTELIVTLERMTELALSRDISLFIIAGDLFDTRRVSKSLCERVLRIIEGTPSVEFLYLSGNHEKNAIVESGLPLPRNLRIFSEDWTYFDYGDITVAGRSELSEDMFATLRLDPKRKNVVVLHGALLDRSSRDAVGIKDAADRGIDYLALGHYHSYSVRAIDERGIAVYCGSPEGRGFDEVGDKGAVVVDLSAGRPREAFVPLARRRLHIVKVDITEASGTLEIEDEIAAQLRDIPGADMVRVELCGKRLPELFPATDAIVTRWQDRFYHFELTDLSRTKIDPESYRYDKSFKGEFIRTVLEAELSDEDKEAVIRAGIAALLGEDTDL